MNVIRVLEIATVAAETISASICNLTSFLDLRPCALEDQLLARKVNPRGTFFSSYVIILFSVLQSAAAVIPLCTVVEERGD